ncbi:MULTISPECIES: hypothetical protein [Streptomyces]|uniref:hypothetical protein n=1 Tax=Streptomyces TaxID=1883 RepID=UPI00068EBF15|nr:MULTISPECIES: hypothetical protein [Streptomyces]
MGVEYRQTPEILRTEDQEQRRARLEEHRARLRDAFGSFRHTCQVATVHARSSEAIDACDHVFAASRTVYMTLGDIAEGATDASAFHVALDHYWTAVHELGKAVRLEEP